MMILAELDKMDRTALGRLWTTLLGGAVPSMMSQGFQRHFLAHALQIKAKGDVPPSVARRLDQIQSGAERRVTPSLATGARLLRQWNGTTHVVDVVEGGFRWNGSQHRSLSAIARAITGTRWSGPRFFGLANELGKGDGPAKASDAKAKGAPPRPKEGDHNVVAAHERDARVGRTTQ